MNREPSASRSTHGSYVQLSTFDDKEKTFVQTKSSLPTLWPYKREEAYTSENQYVLEEEISKNSIRFKRNK
ncbi:hypothetical protein TNCT_311941 [Trichonephila clavata]|uniref:Uncharacterized protein n=1 Tax=Trichonephila clavata TaxID=2740835 RepID=A0A8X6L703_TRICU|nr:hypothetical protein TNCT_311941 [Trichonephila clavata]